MSTQAPTTAPDDDMPAEIDFAKGQRGKFYRPGMRPALPVYLDERVQAALTALARAKGVDLSNLIDDLLRKRHRIDRTRALSPQHGRGRCL